MRDQLIIGIHAVRSALKHGARRIDRLWFDAERRDRRLRQLLDEARAAGVELTPSEKATLDRMTGGANHQGVVAKGEMPASLAEAALDELLGTLDVPPMLLVLDGVTDPHNLGACLRSADATGVHAVIAPRDRAGGLSPVACKVASGAAETVPFVQVTNLVRTLRHLQDAHRVFVVGTSGDAALSLFEADLHGPLALVMGAEGEGMRQLTRKTCDALVHLPMAGQVHSLNVSVAAGVCLYEAARQRAKP
ncbi:MAG: 23S rRNA (guanosine(2251)-2'-O)-methyltransferase RlmB [Chromatiaceae bacterium]|nr:23S rRNA (guanosine(2251)-2'-O)-methyltransferase RlmB [Gammaproteobacteria bacterium]MCP5301149.1 23S rRNA (guanosine(2251)-2'-O)-methyltransferase RlmB [Chromatiaceae bacterium]MCP5421379.1 23S rRNA (guanosine(2251)-2'-O)-methyltransferase RlmB [Chromatiaceae bacterium]